MQSKFFTDNTWARANPACTRADMNDEFMTKLERAREIAGVPFVINSAFRTVEHEQSRGRSGSSSHTTGRAVDIQAIDSRRRFHIIRGLYAAGFDRIGHHPTFIHVDDSPAHDKEVFFGY